MAVLQSQLKIGVIDAASSKLRAISAQLNAFQARNRIAMSPLTGLFGRVAAFGGAYLGVTQGIDKTVTAAREMQSSLTEIGIKADLSGGQLDQLRNRVVSLSPTVKQSTSELLAGVDAMVTLGLGAGDAAAAIPAIGRAATATGATMADLSAASVSAMQNLKVAPEEISRMLDSMAFAGNRGAFELRDMAQYLPALGAAYQGLGQEGVPAVTDLAAALQIVRKGTGDSASAATNLQNILQKIAAPQTRAAFRKMGVNLGKEMQKATKRGLTPIEAIAEITNKALKGDLSKIGDLFSDAEVQKGLRPLIQNMEEYRRIRADAASADGTIAAAFAARMQNADEKIKAFQVRVNNLGASIGTKLLGPIGDAAEYFSNIFDTLDSRVTVFDTIGSASRGFLAGLGLDGGAGAAMKQIGDFLFGVQENGVKAGEQLGRITKNFREFGESVRSVIDAVTNNPIGQFFAEMGGYGLKLFLTAAAIGAVARAMMSLAKAAALLSGLTTAMGILKSLSSLGSLGGTATPTKATFPGVPALPGPLLGLTAILATAAAIAKYGPQVKERDNGPNTPSDYFNRIRAHNLGLSGQTHSEERERDDSVAPTWFQRFMWGKAAERGFDARDEFRIDRGQNSGPAARAPAGNAFDKMMGGMDLAAALSSATVKTQPTGIQQVQVTNPVRPNISVSAPITINEASDGAAIANQLASRIKSAVEGTFGDMDAGL